MFKYLWIVALVLIFEFIGFLPFQKHILLEEIIVSVFWGNFIGIIIGSAISVLISVVTASFCEFFGIEWQDICLIILDAGTIIGAIIGYVYSIVQFWD